MPKFQGYYNNSSDIRGPFAKDVLDKMQPPQSQPQVILDEIEREKARAKKRKLYDSLKAKKLASKQIDQSPLASSTEQPVPTLMPDVVPTSMPNSVPDLYPEPNVNLEYKKEPEPSSGPLVGFLDRSAENKPDSRQMLYDYLTQRRESEPAFQDNYRELSDKAESGRVMATLGSGLGEMASMAGTVGGKRADVGDIKSLPNAIYGARRREADESLALRRLANQEQVSDIRLLRDLERGDLDALRTQKILADLNRQKDVPKTLPYFVPGDGKTPPKMVMMRSDGTVEYRDLPPGAKPTNDVYSLGQPVYTPQGGVMYPQTSKGGETRFIPGPEGAKTAEQLRIENQAQADAADARLKQIEIDRKTANDKERQKLDREELDLKKAMAEWKQENPKPGKDIAGESLDRAFAKDYEQYIAMGGKSSLLKKLQTLQNARQKLETIKPPPRMAGALGESGMTFLAPEYSEIMSDVRGAIQETLRQTLGSQFTEREGEQILSRAFDPRQTKEANIRKLDREIEQIVERAKAKQQAVDYFEKNGTLRGFQSGSSLGEKKPVRKQYSPSRNQTKITYSDGSTEVVEGRQ